MSLPLPPVHNYMLQIFKKQKQSLKYLHVLLQNRARQRTKQNLLKYISSNRTYHKIGLIYVYSVSQSVCNIGYLFYNFVTEINCLVSDLVAVFLVTTAASGSPEKKNSLFPKKDLTWKSFPSFFKSSFFFLLCRGSSELLETHLARNLLQRFQQSAQRIWILTYLVSYIIGYILI